MENEKPSSLPSALERLRNKYRLVIMNDDTYEEVITFRLSRLSVYVAMSTIFVLMIVFTTALIMFTPLKYYIPGYGSQESRSALQVLKIRTDSLEHSIRQKDMYLENVKKVLNGDATTIIDTTLLPVEPVEYSDDF
ncbi:MAG: hypothetical protein MUE72_11330 [Chitinophagaceae bacterium]|jgi:hypothetical protein|nr:hypothetical protein [Hydrotalea sp.]MCU0323001.1 hypothetical protein [Chitinophagaceae bacterium]